MKILSYPCVLSAPTAVALGRFDGIHIAHRKVICAAAEDKKCGLIPAVFTFRDNPNKAPHDLLTTEQEKLSLIEDCGIELTVNCEFAEVRSLSPEEFVDTVLAGSLCAKKVYCGYNYRFGKGAAADVGMLEKLCFERGISVTCLSEISEDNISVSSTSVRKLLSEGNIITANSLLGRSYTLSGRVIHGRALGRTIETPTLNLDIPDNKLLPRFGVYATYAAIDGVSYASVTNIGLKPTVGSATPTIETYLLDTEGDFYGKEVTLELKDFIRPEQKFSSLPELQSTIQTDIQKAKDILK